MSAPRIKVFDASGKYQASTHDYAAASALMGLYGEGATVRLGHAKKDVIWTEGQDGLAADNYDVLAGVIAQRDQQAKENLERLIAGA